MEDDRAIHEKMLAVAKARWPEIDADSLHIVTTEMTKVIVPFIQPLSEVCPSLRSAWLMHDDIMFGQAAIEIEDVNGFGLGYDPKLNVLAVKIDDE